MPTFGKLLQAMRKSRGLTQIDLAAKAGCSVFTISNGETADAFGWKRSTAIDVLRALESIAPLTDNESENYLQLAGLEALARMGRDAIATIKAGRDAIAHGMPSAISAYSTQGDPDRTTAHSWLERLFDEAGAVRVLSSLEGMAAAWNVDLQPRIRREDESSHGIWIHRGPIIETGDGHTVQEFSGHKPPAPPPTTSKAAPKRRSAS